MANNKGDWRYKLFSLMAGRYGFDQLSRDMFIASIVLVIINIIFSSTVISVIALLLVIASLARMLSRNIVARRNELQIYQELMVKPRAWWRHLNEVYLEKKAKRQGKRVVSQAQAATKAAAKERKKQQRAQRGGNTRSGKEPGSRRAARAERKGENAQGSSPSTSSANAESNIIVVFPCEECGQSLSVPRGKGTLRVTCPKCGHIQHKRS